jgi:hypothetical protein
MNSKMVGNKADVVRNPVKNAESSSTISKGRPCVLAINGTDDGLAVVLPATAGAAKSNSLLYGIALDDILAGKIGEVVVFGISRYTIITRMTRAASSDSWTSSASVNTGVLLGADTINNALTLGASLASNFNAMAVLAETLASSAASATATSDTRTAITNAVRVFVKLL